MNENNTTRHSRHCDYMGRAAEYAVAAQLMLKDTAVLWPSVDAGYDLLTESFCRVQVKSSHIDGRTDEGQGYYWFPLGKTRQVVRKNCAVRVAVPDITKICDVVVFWGIEEKRFWVVPSSLCLVQGVALGLPNPKRFVGSIQDMREMLALGYTRGKIAKHYGIQRSSLQQFLDSGKDYANETVTSQMRSCEGRWDYITDFVKSAAPMNAPVAPDEREA